MKVSQPSWMVLATPPAAVGLSSRMCTGWCCRGLGLRAPCIVSASGLQDLLDVGPDFFVLRELAALGGGDAALHTFKKTGDAQQQPQGGIFHQLFSVRAAVIGNLRKLRFLPGVASVNVPACTCARICLISLRAP